MWWMESVRAAMWASCFGSHLDCIERNEKPSKVSYSFFVSFSPKVKGQWRKMNAQVASTVVYCFPAFYKQALKNNLTQSTLFEWRNAAIEPEHDSYHRHSLQQSALCKIINSNVNVFILSALSCLLVPLSVGAFIDESCLLSRTAQWEIGKLTKNVKTEALS